jgi:hypothetical protein
LIRENRAKSGATIRSSKGGGLFDTLNAAVDIHHLLGPFADNPAANHNLSAVAGDQALGGAA